MLGWIALYRKIRKNPIFNNHELLRLWLICLTEATHRERDQIVGKQSVHLIPGDFVTGRFELQGMYNDGLKRDLQKSPYTVWRWLELLQTSQFLSIKSSSKFSVVSIDKWDKYQKGEQEIEHEVSTKRAANEHEVSTNNNVNNKKDIKTLSRQPKTYAEDDPYYRMAAYFFERLKTFVDKIGKGHLIQNSNLQTWADDFRKICELDKRPRTELGEVVNWATSDPFWQKNILSPDKLRKKYTELCLKMSDKNGSVSNSNVNDKLFEKNKAEAQKIMEAMEREGIGNKDIILKN